MTILVTGGSGFVGKNLVSKLRNTYSDVVCINSNPWDLRDATKVEYLMQKYTPDTVIHLAGSVGGILANKENPGKFLYDNLIMGANIIEMSRRYRVPKFVMLGTVCSYPKLTPVPFKESDFWNGYPEETNAPYGIAKKTLVEMLIGYRKQYDFKSTVLIPSNMYGPHDHFNLTTSHVIPALIMKVHTAIKNDEPSITVWGTGEASREFLFVEDCADAIIAAISTDTDSQPINIGTGQEIKIIDLVEEIANQMGYKGTIFFDKTKPDGQPRRCLDVSRAESVLGFKAKTNLKEGLEKTINWYRRKNEFSILHR